MIAIIFDAVIQSKSFLSLFLWLVAIFCFGWGIYNIFGPGRSQPPWIYVAVSMAAKSVFVPFAMLCAGAWAFSISSEDWWKYAAGALAHIAGKVVFRAALRITQKSHWKNKGG